MAWGTGGSPRRGGRTRLAVVSDTVYPWMAGGKEKRHHEILTRLAARGVQVDVYTMKWWDGPRVIERHGIRYHALCKHRELYDGDRRSIRQALAFAVATLAMVTKRYDALEVDAIPLLPMFPMRLVAWLRRTPLVGTWHEYWGTDYWREYLGGRGRLAAFLERSAVILPDLVIANSDATAARIHDDHPGRRLRVIPCGVDLPAEVPVRAVATDPAGRPITLVSVGRLLPNKSVDRTLQALGLLVERGHDARLTVIGRGPEEARLHQLADDLGISDRVTFIPFVEDHADVLAHLAAADVHVFPSVREGFGMVVLEAMSVGTPTVTSNHRDNFAQYLLTHDQDGMVCDPRPLAIADAVLHTAENRPRLSQGAAATARHYDWEVLTDQAAAAYDLNRIA